MSKETLRMNNHDKALVAAEAIAKNALTRSDFETRDLIMRCIEQAYFDGRTEALTDTAAESDRRLTEFAEELKELLPIETTGHRLIDATLQRYIGGEK